MTISSTTNRVSYAGNGSTTVFSFPYYFLADADLVVIDVLDSDGTETLKTLTTHYTVSGEGEPAGGSVTMLTAPASGHTLVIYRDVAIVQPLDLVANDPSPAESTEESFDRLTMIAQRLDERADRAVTLPEGLVGAFDTKLPAALNTNVGATIVVNATGDGFDIGPTATEISDAATEAAAAAASAVAAATSETNAADSELIASQWATKTTGLVQSSDYSAKEWAKGTFTRGAASGGSAKDWATYTGGTVDDAEYSAKKYAQDAAAAVASCFFRDVVYKTNADSPVTVSSSDNGKVFVFDSSGGAITVNLPQISTLTPPFNLAFLLKTAGNTVTINRAGTDTIMGSTTKSLSAAGVGFQLAADTDASPDDWSALDFGAVADASVAKTKLDGSTTSGPDEISNLSLSVTASSNILTFALKDKAGSDASASSPITVALRSSTATSGVYNTRSITGALSQTFTQGTSCGLGAQAQDLWLYLIDSNGSGTMKLGAAPVHYEDGSLQSTVAESMSATATNATPCVFTVSSHGMVNGDAVRLTGTPPTGFSTGTTYYVVNKAASTFELAATPAGSSIASSSTGSAIVVHYCGASIASDAVYTSMPIRCLGKANITFSTIGNWVTPNSVSNIQNPAADSETIAMKAYSTATSFSHNATTTVVWTTTAYDTINGFNGTTYQVKKAGKYRVTARLNSAASAAAATERLWYATVAINGTIKAYGPIDRAYSTGSREYADIVTSTHTLALYDRITIGGFTNLTGASVNGNGGAEGEIFFSIEKIN